MTKILRPRFWIAAIVICLAALAWHWQPGRQVMLHQKHLLEAVENRKWQTVGEFLSADYSDRWGQTKPVVLERLPEVFGDFLSLGVLLENERLTDSDGLPTVEARIRIVGSGGPLAQYIIERTESIQTPFSFSWRRGSWMPWDWALVSMDQPELEVPADTLPTL